MIRRRNLRSEQRREAARVAARIALRKRRENIRYQQQDHFRGLRLNPTNNDLNQNYFHNIIISIRIIITRIIAFIFDHRKLFANVMA